MVSSTHSLSSPSAHSTPASHMRLIPDVKSEEAHAMDASTGTVGSEQDEPPRCTAHHATTIRQLHIAGQMLSPSGHGVASIPIRVLYSHAGPVGTAEDLLSQTTKSSDHVKDQVI